jgi:hypothetical protein
VALSGNISAKTPCFAGNLTQRSAAGHGRPVPTQGLEEPNFAANRGPEKRFERRSKKGLQGLVVGRKYAFTSGAEAVLGQLDGLTGRSF